LHARLKMPICISQNYIVVIKEQITGHADYKPTVSPEFQNGDGD